MWREDNSSVRDSWPTADKLQAACGEQTAAEHLPVASAAATLLFNCQDQEPWKPPDFKSKTTTFLWQTRSLNTAEQQGGGRLPHPASWWNISVLTSADGGGVQDPPAETILLPADWVTCLGSTAPLKRSDVTGLSSSLTNELKQHKRGAYLLSLDQHGAHICSWSSKLKHVPTRCWTNTNASFSGQHDGVPCKNMHKQVL